MSEKRALRFSVLGQDGAIHDVTIEQEIDNSMNLSSNCSCTEAVNSAFCGHQFDIFSKAISTMSWSRTQKGLRSSSGGLPGLILKRQ